MGLFDSVFGSKEKTNSSGLEQVRGSQGVQSTTNSKSTMDQFAEILERIQGNTSSSVRKGGPEANSTLDNIVNLLATNFSGDQREVGRVAAKDASKAAIQNVMMLGLPDIRTASTAAGGYDSTTRQTMTDNLAAQAAREGASVELEAMQAFSNQQIQGIAQALQAVLQYQEGNIVTDVAEDQTRAGSESSRGTEDQTSTTDQLTSTEMDTAQSGTVTSRGRDSLFDNALKFGDTVANVVSAFKPTP